MQTVGGIGEGTGGGQVGGQVRRQVSGTGRLAALDQNSRHPWPKH